MKQPHEAVDATRQKESEQHAGLWPQPRGRLVGQILQVRRGTGDPTTQTGLQVWAKALSGNAHAVALFNRNGSAASITVTFTQVGIASGKVTVRDLWQKADLGSFEGSYTATSVPSHGVVMLRLSQ
jgi:hypothetical protein